MHCLRASPAVRQQELIKEAGMVIINKIPSMVKSHVDLASYLVEDAFGSVRDISKNVISHYTVAASMQVKTRRVRSFLWVWC